MTSAHTTHDEYRSGEISLEEAGRRAEWYAAVIKAATECRQGLEVMLAASTFGVREYDAMEWRRAANDTFELLRDALDAYEAEHGTVGS